MPVLEQAQQSSPENRRPRRPLAVTAWALMAGGLIVGGVIGYVVAPSAGPSTPTEESTSTEEIASTEEIVEQWVDALNAMDPELGASLYAEDAVFIDTALGEEFQGRRGIESAWSFGEGFEIRELEVVSIGPERAVARWTFGGTKTPLGSQRAWEVTGVSILEVSGGEITAETVYYDSDDVR